MVVALILHEARSLASATDKYFSFFTKVSASRTHQSATSGVKYFVHSLRPGIGKFPVATPSALLCWRNFSSEAILGGGINTTFYFRAASISAAKYNSVDFYSR